MIVVILVTSRSGSSIVAQVFNRHGFDVGDYENTRFGYGNYENKRIKNWLKQHKPEMNFRLGALCDFVPGVVVPKNACIKVAVEYWPIFKPLDPVVVTVSRKPENILASLMDKNPSDDSISRSIIKKRFVLMDKIRKQHGGVDVNTDDMMGGDYNAIRRAVEATGVKFNPEAVSASIDPSKWHYR